MANNLIINATKTVALFTSTNVRKPVIDLTLNFNHGTVYSSNTAKYLGVLVLKFNLLSITTLKYLKVLQHAIFGYYNKCLSLVLRHAI